MSGALLKQVTRIADAWAGPGRLNIPLRGATLVDGTALADFSNGASATPGWDNSGSEMAGIRWNNNATLTPIMLEAMLFEDFNAAYDVVVKAMLVKSGATAGDITTLTIGAFMQKVGDLYDADADFGGVSSAVNPTATAKTVQLVTRTLALANLAAGPLALNLTVQPTDGTLGTDDATLQRVWLEYVKKPFS